MSKASDNAHPEKLEYAFTKGGQKPYHVQRDGHPFASSHLEEGQTKGGPYKLPAGMIQRIDEHEEQLRLAGKGGGQMKQIVELPMDVIRSAGDVTGDIAFGMAQIIGSTTAAIAEVAKAAGSMLGKMSKSLKVASVKVMDSVGEIAPKAASKLGKIVGVVPILGKPAAYVVKGAGKGVYYVVTSVGDITGAGIKGVGKVGKAASDMVVFTIATTGKTTQKIIDEAGEMIHNVTRDIAGKPARKTAKKSKTKKAKKAKKSGKGKGTRRA